MAEDRLFQALSDATRLEILSVLAAGPINVSKIVTRLGCSQPAVSRHLRVLREASLIRDKRKGKEVEYSINPAVIQAAVERLAGLVAKVPEAKAEAVRSARVRGSGSGAAPREPSGRERSGRAPGRAAQGDFKVKESDYKVERKPAGMDDFLL